MTPIFHLSLSVSQLEKSVAFYRDQLGAELGRQTDHWVDLWLFGTQLTLYSRAKAVIPARFQTGQHLGATLSWSEWAIRRVALETAGVELAAFAVEDESKGVAKLLVADPDGYLIELKAYRSPEAALGRAVSGYGAMGFDLDVLADDFVRLEPYHEGLKEEVQSALDHDANVWAYMGRNGCGEHFQAWWSAMRDDQAAGEWINYAVRRPDGQVVGSTSLLDFRPAHRTVEIEATFLRPDARSSAINPAMKRLLHSHAFDRGATRVEFTTDTRNVASQRALDKLGANREGIRRHDRRLWNGHVRDSVLYAVIEGDWPQVRATLDRRLG